MADQDILQRIIQNDPSRMGGVFRPRSVEALAQQNRDYLGQTQPLIPDDFSGGRVPAAPPAPDIQPNFTPRQSQTAVPGFGNDAFTAPIETGGPSVTIPEILAPAGRAIQRGMSPTPNIDTPEFRQLEAVNPELAAQLRQRAAEGIPRTPPVDSGELPRQAGLPPGSASAAEPGYPGEGQLPRNPDIMFGGRDAGTQTPQTPAERAQAGLQAAGRGESIPVDPMAPEQFDPETGERSDEARKLGLLERMFGEQGSPEYRSAGRALMMAGAAIMSTDGNLGEALGNGIQAGLMQYDDVLTALREEEAEARAMGMAEEAHALNMQLKQIQIANAGRRGSLKGKAAEPELTKTQQAAVLADEFVNLGLNPDMALPAAINRIYGVPVGLARPPAEDPLSFALGQ